MPVDKPSKEELSYWENVMHDHRLGMGRGRRKWLSYGHVDLQLDEAGHIDDRRKVVPPGAKPE